MIITRNDWLTAAALTAGLFILFNANGREIGSYDSQPTKFAARELLLRGTLSLNHVVGRTPELMPRHGFQLANDGRWRSAYSPVPAIAAAVVMWPFYKSGLLDIRAPLAPHLISIIASSLLVALALALCFLAARLYLPSGRALTIVVGAGLGTGLWSTASQTLWQHETAVFGLSVAVLSLCLMDVWTRSGERSRRSAFLIAALAAGLGLGIAAGARLQLAPAVIMIIIGISATVGWRYAFVAASAVAIVVVPVCAANVRWFGSILGAAPMLEALHESVHGSSGSFSLSSGGYAGLLVSPNRGLFIFSPIVLFAATGLRQLLTANWRSPIVWCTLAAFAQYTLYASYVVWWAGHTYGPRYMLDVLPLLLPLAVAAATRLHGKVSTALVIAALVWSTAVAGIGAFCHPQGRWNNEPSDVDRTHDRLWDWSDSQIARTWRAGASPQNFSLLTRDAVRAPRP